MNLGKLLGAGKSFVSGGKPAAYREDKRFYLPQFGSPKNPFAPAHSPASANEAPKSRAADPVASPLNSTPQMAKTERFVDVGVRGATARATTWVSKLNPAAIFGHAPVAAKNNLMAVQVELSLEKVKVVHNDLTDAEVEVVPLKSRPAREPEAPPAAAKS